MAEIVDDIIKTINESNDTTTEVILKRTPASTEGMLIAYISLVIMAVVSILIGSFRSVKLHIQNKIKNEVYVKSMTIKDALMFPMIASGVLFTHYIVFRVSSIEHIHLLSTYLLNTCFYIVGVLTLYKLFGAQFSAMLPKSIPNTNYQLQFTEGIENNELDWINLKFTLHEVLYFIFCATLGSLYLYTKHWMANNIFGLVIAINLIEGVDGVKLYFNNIKIGCILLCGLFVYDIFWFFGTEVIVTIVTSFDIMFSQDTLENGVLTANKFAMLGLRNIIIPGIFIAFLLKLDQSLKRKTNLYFNATLVAYFLGLLTTAFIMYIYEASQPALLYLVSVCITPMLVDLVFRDLKALFRYEDHIYLETEKYSEEFE